MKSRIICCLVTVSFLATSFAQKQSPNDSLEFYETRASVIRGAYFDSMRNNAQLRELDANISRLKAKADNYTTFSLYLPISSADFEKFNGDNEQSGFPGFSGPVFGFGIGFSYKKNRRIFNMHFAAPGFFKKVKTDDGEIKTSFSTLLQFEWGYDFVKSPAVNVYPFAGVGLRNAAIEFVDRPQVNSGFVNLTDIIQHDGSVSAMTYEVGYQAGLGIELQVTDKRATGGILAFLTAGTNGAFRNKSFKIEGQHYDPGLKYGKLVISLGFKFFGR